MGGLRVWGFRVLDLAESQQASSKRVWGLVWFPGLGF